MFKCLLASLLLVCACVLSAAQSGPRLFSRLTVNQTHVVFAYAGDIWSVEHAGGEAKRLTNHPAEENFPSFSRTDRRSLFRGRSAATGMFT
jgi:tricorn protease